jgi:D-aminopeptidase
VQHRRPGEVFWGLPVVGETWDGHLSDINGFHVQREHVAAALACATGGPVEEGNVGGGTGMVCHGFKGGIGTSSRRVQVEGHEYTVGVLVQANHGIRARLRVNGVAVGELIGPEEVPVPDDEAPPTAGSIIGVVATDAPLLAQQCAALSKRAALGVARTGGAGEHLSGDLFVAFATANQIRVRPSSGRQETDRRGAIEITALVDGAIDQFFYAVIEATEEAILNALLAARTMTGRDGVTAHRLEPARLLAALGRSPQVRAGETPE